MYAVGYQFAAIVNAWLLPDSTPTVPDGVIDELRQCFEAEEPMAVDDRLYPGADVTVAEGAFLGFSGIVVRVLPARQRVQILLEFLGRTTIAEVDRASSNRRF